jgi:hypothetical protein
MREEIKMEVTIDVRKLMTTLEVMNPEADFTLTKVYLFDLAMGKEAEVKTPAKRGRPKKIEEPQIEEFVEEEKEPEHEQLELNKILSPKPKAHLPKTQVVVKTNKTLGKPTREETLAKRAEMERLRNIPTKELLAQLTSEVPRDGNQFTSEGMDSISPGGDIEIG